MVYSSGKSLESAQERAQAAADSMALRRIIRPTKAAYTKAKQLEMMVCISFEIRKDQLGPGRGNAKKARAATADAYKVTDQTVSTYSTRWKKDIDALLNKIVLAGQWRNLTRTEFLKRVLLDMESISLDRRKL